MKNYYKILEIDDAADSKEILSAYRRLAKLYHPDVNPHHKLASEMFSLVNAAYEVLSDPQKRKAYDSKLKESAKKASNVKPKPDKAKSDRRKGAEKQSSATGTHHWDQQDHTGYTHWDPDSGFFNPHDIQADNAFNPFQEEIVSRLPVFIILVFLADICLGAYYVHYYIHLDLYLFPQRDTGTYGFPGWPEHLQIAMVLQGISVFYSMLELLKPWLQKMSFFVSILELLGVRIEPLSVVHLVIKVATAYFFCSPIFGMQLLELEEGVVLFAWLWNVFMTAALFICLLGRNLYDR